MKKFALIFLYVFVSFGVFAQIPDWAINLPKSNNPTMDYLVGIGEGNTYKNAYNEAVCDALRKLILRFGLSVNSNDVMSAVYSGQELTTISRDYNIPPINNVCVSQVKQQGVERVYVLFQIPANAMVVNPVFEPFTKCNKKKDDLKNKLYWYKGKYVAWNIAGAGYPWNIVDGFEFRYGGVLGIGAYLDFGMDFTPILVTHMYYDGYVSYNHLARVRFRYAGGIKLFIYKWLFIDCGYGTISMPTQEVTYFRDHYLEHDDKVAIRNRIDKNGHGLLFHIGYNIVTDFSPVGFFLGISAGASYDFINKVISPSANLKIGIAWDVE